jgi:hypothetical protein
MMTHNHHSYLVRCWELGTRRERIEIEHVQSGSRTVVRSLDAAVAWLKADPDLRVGRAASATRSRSEDCCETQGR